MNTEQAETTVTPLLSYTLSLIPETLSAFCNEKTGNVRQLSVQTHQLLHGNPGSQPPNAPSHTHTFCKENLGTIFVVYFLKGQRHNDVEGSMGENFCGCYFFLSKSSGP